MKLAGISEEGMQKVAKTIKGQEEDKEDQWSIAEVGKFDLEYDGNIVIGNVVVGMLDPEGLSYDQLKELNAEIVRRWNSFEK